MKTDEHKIRNPGQTDSLGEVLALLYAPRFDEKAKTCGEHKEELTFQTRRCWRCEKERENALAELARRARYVDDPKWLYLFALLEALVEKPVGGGGGISARDVYDAVHNPNRFHGGAGW